MRRLDPRQPRALANDEFVGEIEVRIAGRTGKAALDEGAEIPPEFDGVDIGLQALALIALQGLRHGSTFIEASRQRGRILRGFQHANADMGTADKTGIADQRDMAESDVFRFDIVDRLQQMPVRAKHHLGKLRRKIASAGLPKRFDVHLADQRRRNRFVLLAALVGHQAVEIGAVGDMGVPQEIVAARASRVGAVLPQQGIADELAAGRKAEAEPIEGLRHEGGRQIRFIHDSTPGNISAVARHDVGREQPTNPGADAVGADNEIGRNLFTAGQKRHRALVGLPDIEKFDAEVIALRRKRRIEQIEEAAPRGQVLRIVEACELVAVPVERNAAADVDARGPVPLHTGSSQNGSQFGVAGDARTP